MPLSRNREERDPPRRLRRRYLSRSCKTFRYQGNTKLLDLPEAMIREILEYTVPEHGRFYEPWLWVSQLGNLCAVFYKVVKEIALSRPSDAVRDPGLGLPTKMRVDPALADIFFNRPMIRPFSFMESFIAAPWKASRLEELSFSYVSKLLPSSKNPGLFPNVTKLSLCDEVNKPTLLVIPVLFPSLDSLILDECGCFEDESSITPQDLSILGRSFSRPLASIVISGVEWLNSEHLDAFLPYHRQRLSKFHLEKMHPFQDAHVRFSDQTMTLLESFHELRELDLSTIDNAVSREVTESFLQVRGRSLVKLGLPFCPDLGSRVIDILIQHVPNLDYLRFNGMTAFISTEDLERLITGWKPQWLERQQNRFTISINDEEFEDYVHLESLALPVHLYFDDD
jgi:hypothetical protein